MSHLVDAFKIPGNKLETAALDAHQLRVRIGMSVVYAFLVAELISHESNCVCVKALAAVLLRSLSLSPE